MEEGEEAKEEAIGFVAQDENRARKGERGGNRGSEGRRILLAQISKIGKRREYSLRKKISTIQYVG